MKFACQRGWCVTAPLGWWHHAGPERDPSAGRVEGGGTEEGGEVFVITHILTTSSSSNQPCNHPRHCPHCWEQGNSLKPIERRGDKPGPNNPTATPSYPLKMQCFYIRQRDSIRSIASGKEHRRHCAEHTCGDNDIGRGLISTQDVLCFTGISQTVASRQDVCMSLRAHVANASMWTEKSDGEYANWALIMCHYTG